LLTPALREALEAALTANGWSVDGTVPLEIPRQADHGDYASNVALVDPETKKPTRVGFRNETVTKDGVTKTVRVRYAKKSGKDL